MQATLTSLTSLVRLLVSNNCLAQLPDQWDPMPALVQRRCIGWALALRALLA
jgi:hypothetical protein